MGCCQNQSKKSNDFLQVYQRKRYNVKEMTAIRSGAFGVVRTAYSEQNQKGQKVAIKSVNLHNQKINYDLLMNELKILKSLDHPNSIKFQEVYQDKQYIHYVMQYCSGGEILQRIQDENSLNELEIKNIMKQVLSGVAYLHKKGICHRDLKLENLMLTDETENANICIIDFGLSYIYKVYDEQTEQWLYAENMKKLVGSPLYMAPETINKNYDYRCDIWSVGVIFYILLIGFPPFFSDDRQTLYKQIQNGRYQLDKNYNISLAAQNLLAQLLQKNYKKRISAAEALNHPFFKEDNSNQKIDKNIIERLKNHQGSYRLKNEVLKVMISYLDDSDIRKLTEQFKIIDTDHTGMISYDELSNNFLIKNIIEKVLSTIGNLQSEEQIQKIMVSMNLNQNNSIDFSEFIASIMDKKFYQNYENLCQAFNHFDQDNSGYITRDNLKKVFQRCGRQIPDDELEAWIVESDLKKSQLLKILYLIDNQIDLDEFIQMMKKDQQETFQQFCPHGIQKNSISMIKDHHCTIKN